jgi:hypothetical protein
LENIKQEIFNHGPVIAVIPVYRDFLIYKKGLYQVSPRNQRFSTGQAVKIIGWDVRDGQTCWLVENSWGEDWGENGIAYFFSINLDAFWSTKMSFKSKDSQLLQLLTLKTLRLKRCKKEKLKQWTSKENRLNCDRYIQTFWKSLTVIQIFLAGLVFH